MVKQTFDFRDGLDQEKIVYKNNRCDCKGCTYYLLYLCFTYGWTVAWFALFQFAYINHEYPAFWIYISIWFAFVITLITLFGIRLAKFYKRKRDKRRKLEEELERKRLEDEEMLKRRILPSEANQPNVSHNQDKVPLSQDRI